MPVLDIKAYIIDSSPGAFYKHFDRVMHYRQAMSFRDMITVSLKIDIFQQSLTRFCGASS